MFSVLDFKTTINLENELITLIQLMYITYIGYTYTQVKSLTGLQQVGSKIIPYTIAFSCGLQIVVLAIEFWFVQSTGWSIQLLNHTLLCLGWCLQFIVLLRSLKFNNYITISLQTLLSLTAQSYEFYLFQGVGNQYGLKITSLTITGFILILDIINSPPNAAYYRYLVVNDRLYCPEPFASLFSTWTFSWINDLLEKGWKDPLTNQDIPNLLEDDQMDHIIDKWNRFRNVKHSVVWDVLLFTKRYAFLQIVVAILSSTLEFSKPIFINLILQFIQNKQPGDSLWVGFGYILGMFLVSIIQTIVQGQINLNSRHWGIQIRGIFIYEIFKKSLRKANLQTHNADEDQTASNGKIVNLMSSDTYAIQGYLIDIHVPLIDLPLTIALCICGLIWIMGPSVFIGMTLILLSMPLTSWLLSKMYHLTKESKVLGDKRIQITNEALQGIRIIKFMGWENQFIQRIMHARENELKVIYKTWIALLGIWCTSVFTRNSVIILSFLFYSLLTNKPLDAATAFTSVTLLNLVTWRLNDLGQHVSKLLNVQIALKRINSFLEETELAKFGDDHDQNNLNPDTWVGFKKATCGYPTDILVEENENSETTPLLQSAPSPDNSFKLMNLDVVFPQGQLTSIIGNTGSGKTTMLLALLGELKMYSGMYSIPESHLHGGSGKDRSDVAYVPQTPWLMNGTIRENIVFGLEYDEAKYCAVLQACCLLKDLENLEGGDKTQIGEKARAAYSDAKVVLLDDPLSAVDAPTAKSLLNQCILGILKGRTILLVTHAVNLVLPKSNFVVLLKDGAIETQGPPSMLANHAALSEVTLGEIDSSESKVVKDDEEIDGVALHSKDMPTNEEEQSKGSLEWKTYYSYIQASGGLWFVFLVLISYLIFSGGEYGKHWWLQHWTDNISVKASESSSEPSDTGLNSDLVKFIGIYTGIFVIEFIGFYGKMISQYYGGYNASTILHKKLLTAILSSPMRFFETTPVGRILNRFSKDVGEVDGTLQWYCAYFFQLIVGCIARMIMVSYISPYFASSIIIFYFYYRVARYYLASSRELKRIESISSSPIYAQFGETLIGATSIRAFGVEKKCINEMMAKVDDNQRSFFYLVVTNRWLVIRTTSLSAFVLFVAGLSILYSNSTAGWAGLAFTFATQITTFIAELIQIHSTLEMSLNSVERIDEYCEFEQEKFVCDDFKAPSDWPSKGDIRVVDLVVKYAPELPDVLKGVNFSIKAGQKIGIVGRTGAGKSTLSMAFFRIIPFVSGTIFIDDIDISKLGLHDLRSKLTIIPQDPILFDGTLRSNLDPFNKHSDKELWDALKLTHVLESMQDEDCLTLESMVSENGNNFSQGQRQLLCLARALLRKSKLIFMDEATASVDPDTDAKIQQTIRSEMIHGTVLTVAHRLKTIIDYDQVIVMDGGIVAEMGSPLELLEQEGSIFHKMCEESGDYEELYEIASLNK